MGVAGGSSNRRGHQQQQQHLVSPTSQQTVYATLDRQRSQQQMQQPKHLVHSPNCPLKVRPGKPINLQKVLFLMPLLMCFAGWQPGILLLHASALQRLLLHQLRRHPQKGGLQGPAGGGGRRRGQHRVLLLLHQLGRVRRESEVSPPAPLPSPEASASAGQPFIPQEDLPAGAQREHLAEGIEVSVATRTSD